MGSLCIVNYYIVPEKMHPGKNFAVLSLESVSPGFLREFLPQFIQKGNRRFRPLTRYNLFQTVIRVKFYKFYMNLFDFPVGVEG